MRNEQPRSTPSAVFEGKRVLITGGTGSLGQVLLPRLLSGAAGHPERIVVFSRDEAKQHYVRTTLQNNRRATDDVIYRKAAERVEFRIGDVRDLHSVAAAMRGIDIVINAAALKQVPTCEYFPAEAVRTNIDGASNIVAAIRDFGLPIETVVGVSTDKAAKPVNVMGMTKAIQERIFAAANTDLPDTRFVIVRYGNVIASRGSVIPYFLEQVRNGGPLTVTSTDMTRFLLTLNDAVDVIIAAIGWAKAGQTVVPIVPSARMIDVAKALIGDRKIAIEITGVRPGEKFHEVLVSVEESDRTQRINGHYVIEPILPELRRDRTVAEPFGREYSSGDDLMDAEEVLGLLTRHGLMKHLERSPAEVLL